jgi:DNA-binding protein Fis
MRTYRQAMWEAERAYCREVMEAAGGCKTLAASIAGVHRSWLYMMLKRQSPPQHPLHTVNRGNASWQRLGA